MIRDSLLKLAELCQEDFDGLLWGEVGGFDGEASEAGVKGVTGVEAALGSVGVGEDGAGDVLEDTAVKENGERGVEEDGECAGGLLEQKAVGDALGDAAAEGDDGGVLGERRGESAGLEAAEAGFSVLGEYLGDGETGSLFEVGVEIEEVPAEAGGEKASDRGFTGAHEAGERDALNSERWSGRGLWLSFGLSDGLGIHRSLQLLCLNAKNATYKVAGSVGLDFSLGIIRQRDAPSRW
jgi:hypothetical protein